MKKKRGLGGFRTAVDDIDMLSDVTDDLRARVEVLEAGIRAHLDTLLGRGAANAMRLWDLVDEKGGAE